MKVERAGEQRFIDNFLHTPHSIYKTDRHWIPALQQELESIFDERARHYTRYGECERWIVRNSGRMTIGRIAAFIDKRSAFASSPVVGHIGLFDCVDDNRAAYALIETAKDWLMRRKVEVIEGPVYPALPNRVSGLLLHGKANPLYHMNYNAPYYEQLFGYCGFKEYYRHHSYLFDLTAISQYTDMSIYQQLQAGGYRFEPVDLDEPGPFITALVVIYNQAWRDQPQYVPMTDEDAVMLIEQLGHALADEQICVAYQGTTPVGIIMAMPDLNVWFERYEGNFDFWTRMRHKLDKRMIPNTMLIGLLYGVIPTHRAKGIEQALMVALCTQLGATSKWRAMEVPNIGNYDKGMAAVLTSLGGKSIRTHCVYRLVIDQTKHSHQPYTNLSS
jgi:hypothetical protein